MKKATILAAGLVLAAGLAAQAALAQSGTGGSGSASGVTVGCSSQSSCGSVMVSSTLTPSGTAYSLSGPLNLQVITSTSTAEAAAGDDLTPGSETLGFTLSNVFTSSGGTTSGTFTLTDFILFDPAVSGEADFEISGNVLSLTPSTNPTGGSWVLTLAPTTALLDSLGCECTGAGPITLPSGITATMTINFDPGNVTGASGGLSGGAFGTGSSTTPEPGTLLLLGSGLLGLGPLIRRRVKLG